MSKHGILRLSKSVQLVSVLLLAAILSLTSLAQAQDDTDPTGTEEVGEPAQAVSVEPVARDSQIERRITEIMDATGWYTELQIKVDDGIVFLDGVAKTDEHRAWARNLATKTQDVVAVVNRIDVQPELQSSFAPAWAEIKNVVRQGIIALPLFLLAIVILPLAWYAARWVSKGMKWVLKDRIETPFLRVVVARAISIPVFLLGLYIVLQVAGLTKLALSLVGGAGVIGIVIGFAFRDIAENFLASLLLSVRKPFSGGDYIDVGGHQGIVQSMNTRSTVLLSSEGNHIQIPNAVVFKNTIINYSAAPARRSTLDVGIGYDVSTASAQEVIRGVLARHEAVTNDPEPLILVDSLGASTVNLKVYYWIDGQKYSVLKVKSALLRLMKKALTEAGISMPDEAREVVFPQGVPLLRLAGRAKETAQDIAEQDIVETARAEALATETDADATSAEGDLGNETAELEAHAAVEGDVEGDTDLLQETPKPVEKQTA